MNDDYPSIAELERIATAGSGRDLARERREAEEFCREIEHLDDQRALDEVETALSGWVDEQGWPLAGMESPRYRHHMDERKSAYYAWLKSPDGARTRRNMHPQLDAKMRDAFARRDREAGRSVEVR